MYARQEPLFVYHHSNLHQRDIIHQSCCNKFSLYLQIPLAADSAAVSGRALAVEVAGESGHDKLLRSVLKPACVRRRLLVRLRPFPQNIRVSASQEA